MYKVTNTSKFEGQSAYGGTVLNFGPGGVAEVEDITPSLQAWLRAAGYKVEQLADGESAIFDPSEHNVDTVVEYLVSADSAERERVLTAEADGKARAGVVGWTAPAEADGGEA